MAEQGRVGYARLPPDTVWSVYAQTIDKGPNIESNPKQTHSISIPTESMQQ